MEGDPVAQFCLGYMYNHRQVPVPKDLQKRKIAEWYRENAEKWYEKAAEQDYAPAQNNFAVMYFLHAEEVRNKLFAGEVTSKWLDLKNFQKNSTIADQWFQKTALQQNNRIAQYNLALIWYQQALICDGIASKKDENLTLLSEITEHPEIQKILETDPEYVEWEEVVATARDVVSNSPANTIEAYKEAVNWFTKAADGDKNATDNGGKNALDRSYAPAQFFLGEMYYNGEGVEKNLTEAKKWYTKAADKGDARAQFNLGMMYYNGEGVAKNLTETERWKEAFEEYEKAADRGYENGVDKGDARAQFNLGKMYYDGKGVGKDLTKAVKWYTRAARQKHASAQNNLAIMYNKGEGTKQNSEVATRYFFEAAQQGNAIAQSNVGDLFKEGLDGITQDNQEAYYWYSLALKNEVGLENAVNANLVNEVNDRRETVGNRLTEPEKNKIQERVDKWKPKTLVGGGTGFYVSKDHILTNAHVARRRKEPNKEYDEIRINFRFVKEKPGSVDWDVDLALLVDPSKEMDSFAKFRNNRVEVGEMIALFGYPMSFDLSYSGNGTSGQISGLAGAIRDPTRPDYELFSQNLFQHTAPQQGGNSGGPVFDLAGNVVGVAVSSWYAVAIENVSFAIKSNVVIEFLRKNGIQPAPGDLQKRKDDLTDIYENIYEETRKFTVPVWCYRNKSAAPLPVVEIHINEL